MSDRIVYNTAIQLEPELKELCREASKDIEGNRRCKYGSVAHFVRWAVHRALICLGYDLEKHGVKPLKRKGG